MSVCVHVSHNGNLFSPLFIPFSLLSPPSLLLFPPPSSSFSSSFLLFPSPLPFSLLFSSPSSSLLPPLLFSLPLFPSFSLSSSPPPSSSLSPLPLPPLPLSDGSSQLGGDEELFSVGGVSMFGHGSQSALTEPSMTYLIR